MPFVANVLRVLIASPSDTAELRDAVERALHEWNGDRSAASATLLLPRRWETNAVAELTGSDGQSVINKQLVADADLVIGIFHSRLGQQTPRYASGTAEELAEAQKAGKRVHVYFSSMPISRHDVDPVSLQTLNEFKSQVEKLGLYGSFDTPGSLKDQVKSAIEADLLALGLGAPIGGPLTQGGASVGAAYEYTREPNNRGKLVTRRQRLTITNSGSTPASDVTFTLEPADGDDRPLPQIMTNPSPFTLPANGGVISLPVMTYPGTATTATAAFRWQEGGEERETRHTISFF